MKKVYFKILIKPFFYINHRLYMLFFIKIISLAVVKLNGKPRKIGYNVKFDNFSMITIGNPAIKISDLDKKAMLWSKIETNIKKD